GDRHRNARRDPRQRCRQRSLSGRGGGGMSSAINAVPALLSVDQLHAHYGKSHILHGVTFDVKQGEVVSLLGRNGSGRSTTMKALMGVVAPTGGSVHLQGRALTGQRPYTICRAGLAYVPEEREVFTNLTVDENLRMGEQPT